jgi:hypothetical protein
MLTIVYSNEEEWEEYRQYLRYLAREGLVESKIQTGMVEPLQGVSGLKFGRVRILPKPPEPEVVLVVSEITVLNGLESIKSVN